MKKISVVIPSYGRAHLLKKTLPTYIQDNVIELILIDDCSPDKTAQVVAELQKEYPIIRYFHNTQNIKQAASKNIGIDHAIGDYIYFGDDDSVLLPNSMKFLQETIVSYNCDAVMARPIFAGPNYRDDMREEYLKWRLPRGEMESIEDFIDIEHLHFDFDRFLKGNLHPIEVPTCHASALVKTDMARLCKFDPNFKGCAYREETDFFFRLNLDYGAKLMYDARAVQLNLPVYMVKNTGARTGGYAQWRQSAIECNLYFLKKNWLKICSRYGIKRSIKEVQEEFENSLPLKQPKINVLKRLLKYWYFNIFIYRRLYL